VPVRYLDSGDRAAGSTARQWLQQILPSATAFACQTGYFRAAALTEHADVLRAMLDAGGTFRLAVGVNEDHIVANDLVAVLDIIEPWLGSTAHLLVVGGTDALFHPKTYYCELLDGSRQALIGSSNLTKAGLGQNIEANIVISSADDGSAEVLDAVHDAIVAWNTPQRTSNIRLIDRAGINDLIARRIIEPSEYSSPPQRNGRQRSERSAFPTFGRIFPWSIRQPRPPRRTPIVKSLSGAQEFPPGSVGIVKMLSPNLDVKGFYGGSGTPYVALPAAIAPYLPMTPYGNNREPRLDLAIEARLDGALNEPVLSGGDPTNVTWVGKGTTGSSHSDLRLNVLHTVIHSLTYIHSVAGAVLPAGGDALAIEFLDGGRFIRLTYATADPLRTQLLALCTEGRRLTSGWGWLPPNVVPEWTD
jgi:PLD-like domain